LNLPKIRTYIKRVTNKKNKVIIKGRILGITSKILLQKVNFLIIDRVSKKEIISKCDINELWNGLISFEASINLNNCLFGIENNEAIFDAFLIVNNVKTKIRVGNPSFWVKNSPKDFVFSNSDTYMCILTPYYTFKENNLSFKLNVFENDKYFYMRKVMFLASFYRFIYRKREIWLLGELNYRAQDNAMVMYNYLRENINNENVYYVINKGSEDRRNLIDKTNIIDYGSKKHILYTIVAKKILTTHHPDYIFPTSMNKYKKKIRGKKLFLTHGIFGVKNMYKNYGNYVNEFKVDHIITTSERERQSVINQLKYKDFQVSVTGMPRLDKLFISDILSERAILLMPTWRDWLITKEPFEESEYYQRYLSLIQNKELIDMCKKHKVKLTLCLHPNFRMYTKYFSSNFVKIVFQGEINVQELIKSHKLMVTDYSSVAFDFSFLNKPVIFYGFDLARFTNNKESHINIPEDLPGEFVSEDDQLIQMIKFYINNNFSQKSEHRVKANVLIKYKDLNASKRVYNVAKNLKKSNKRYSDNLIMKVIMTAMKKMLNIPT